MSRVKPSRERDFAAGILPPEANVPLDLHISRSVGPVPVSPHPRAAAGGGGNPRYTMNRVPASEVSLQTFCRRRPTPRLALTSADLWDLFLYPRSREPPRSGDKSRYTLFRVPASDVSLQPFFQEFYRRRPMPGYTFMASYTRNRLHIPHTCGGANIYHTYQVPATRVKLPGSPIRSILSQYNFKKIYRPQAINRAKIHSSSSPHSFRRSNFLLPHFWEHGNVTEPLSFSSDGSLGHLGRHVTLVSNQTFEFQIHYSN
ncbi:hypothetical protein C8R43DRAFT_1105203 [Mycena crocata]|nr:hypothetical protein C8R43DRAFT_1105203 [Mycena crocata]